MWSVIGLSLFVGLMAAPNRLNSGPAARGRAAASSSTNTTNSTGDIVSELSRLIPLCQVELWQIDPIIRFELERGTTTVWASLATKLIIRESQRDLPFGVFVWLQRRCDIQVALIKAIPVNVAIQDQQFLVVAGFDSDEELE